MQISQNLTTVNYNSRGTNPTWIVLHYTANDGDTAWGNTNYFKSVNRGASAHYFVDENSTVWQCVRDTDTAWHVGANSYNNAARNNNSIGIEMCSRIRSGGSAGNLRDYYLKDQTVANAVELTKSLMKKYNIPASRVCRHYDVTGKICPAPMYYNNGTVTWTQFKNRLTADEVDLTAAELRAMVAAAIQKDKDDIAKKACPTWASTAVQYCINQDLISGDGGTPTLNNVRAQSDITRAEMCVILHKMKAKKQ